jgi:hypothetical protein
MKALRIPSVQDIARIVRPTSQETVLALKQFHETKGGFWNYRTSQAYARLVFDQTLGLTIAQDICAARPSKAERAQNCEVLTEVHHAGRGRKIFSYEVRGKSTDIRRDMRINVRPTFAYVENSVPKIFWLQPRRHFALSIVQLGFLASLVRKVYLVDDFEKVQLEIFDLSVPEGSKDRRVTLYRSSDLPEFSDAEIDQFLSVFAEAHDVLIRTGFSVPQRRAPTSERPAPGPDMFGE